MRYAHCASVSTALHGVHRCRLDMRRLSVSAQRLNMRQSCTHHHASGHCFIIIAQDTVRNFACALDNCPILYGPAPGPLCCCIDCAPSLTPPRIAHREQRPSVVPLPHRTCRMACCKSLRPSSCASVSVCVLLASSCIMHRRALNTGGVSPAVEAMLRTSYFWSVEDIWSQLDFM